MFNPMKRKMFFRLTAVCLMAVSVLIACTKDYGSDIKQLQDDMDKLSNKVDALDKAIHEDGAVITDVSPIQGGTRVTLSNGKTFDIKNGNDGKDGKDGTVWKIGDNGNWWSSENGQPFVDTGKKAKGEDGKDGKDAKEWYIGDNGNWWSKDGDTLTDSGVRAEGKSAYEVAKANDPAVANMSEDEWIASLKGDKGDPGKDGVYYKPCTDKSKVDEYGHWLLCDPNEDPMVPKCIDDMWLPEGTLTAIWNPKTQDLEIHNVEGAEDGIVVINTAKLLKSIALIPELWDAALGMPTAQVYAITPSAWETSRLLYAKTGTLPRWLDYFNQHGGAGLNGTWANFNYKENLAYWNVFFWCALWNSWLGVTGLKDSWYFEDSYDPTFDLYTTDYDEDDDKTWFKYWYMDVQTNASEGFTTELTYADLAAAVKECVEQMGTRLANVSKIEEAYTRQPPVSALNLKYRINPSGADIDGYQFSMIDRGLQVLGNYETYFFNGRLGGYDYPNNGVIKVIESKAEGDHRNSAVAKLETEKVGDDQLNVTGYVDYFKYWADKPTEWFIMIMTTTAAMTWDYWQQNLAFNSIPTAEYWSGAQGMGQEAASHGPVDGQEYRMPASYSAMRNWLEEQGMSFETIVALEAAKSAKGAEAVVSDYNSVKLNFVTPIWTAYNHRYRYADAYTARWRIAANMAQIAAYKEVGNLGFEDPRTFENDYLVEGKPYDVAAHMRFADPYYGKLEDLGFTVKYDYYVYEAKNSGSHDYNSAWSDGDDNPCGETEENFGGWDKVTCTSAGVVQTKEDATDAIGKYVVITADASIKNEATGTWYTSETRGNFGGMTYMNGYNVDEFAGHYVLLIVPDPEKVFAVTYDLGTLDYLKLPKSFTLPAPFKSKDPGAPHDWEKAVDMDMDGFNNVYDTEPVLTSASQPGFSKDAFARDADAMFTVSLDNQAKIGSYSVTYTFKSNDNKFKPITYTIKWKVDIDWTATEPILNDDYVLFTEEPEWEGNRFVRGTGTLAETDITPDPATKYTTPNRIDDAFDTSKFPYVDSIVTVKGKEVDGVWKPQSSIKEHIREYGSYLASEPNIENMQMVINFPKSMKEDGAEIIPRVVGMGDSYQNQDIKLTTPFAMGEQSRDYVVDIKVTLANGTSHVVKAYIVRFICPFYIEIDDTIELFTHTADWCSDRVLFNIRETGTGKLLVYWDTETPYGGPMRQWVTSYARETYGRQVFSNSSITRPQWHSLADATFGNRLLYNERTGWFYWCNMGTDLQADKTTTYKVTQEIRGLAYLTGEGDILIHKTADSPAAHADEGHGDEREPDLDNPNIHATWEIAFE